MKAKVWACGLLPSVEVFMAGTPASTPAGIDATGV
jgi:hypothetical protein